MGLDESIPSSPAIPSLAEEGAIDEVLSDLPPLKLRNLIQLEYKSLFSWEVCFLSLAGIRGFGQKLTNGFQSVVRSVDGIERLESGELMAFVVWYAVWTFLVSINVTEFINSLYMQGRRGYLLMGTSKRASPSMSSKG